MRLADFILANIEPILADWVSFARTITPEKDITILRDHAAEILQAAALDMKTTQTSDERSEKSKGHDDDDPESQLLDSASVEHAIGRANTGFDTIELLSEYRALRASVIRLWRESLPDTLSHDLDDLTRFNEAIDQSAATAVESYTERVDETREIFLAILGHDLRNPLAALKLGAQVLSQTDYLNTNLAKTADKMIDTANQMDGLILDLLDFAVTRMGHGIPIVTAKMNLSDLCQNGVTEIQAAHPERTIRCASHGDLDGTWDARRLRQVISNLLGNAIQYGAVDMPVDLTITGEASEVVINVHNDGEPIPPDRVLTLFHPMSRWLYRGLVHRPGNIGLGLYIVREIATAHDGSVQVTSSRAAGTDFTVRLPREPVSALPA
ncbi:MAG: sensor histidine kinase [Pseudohongiella sp.]|uniref:ATP-binding protein n=1 Tax=Pseudohongiella sp. TaxID=1979412 RepID=UPI0034A0742C